MRQQPYDAFVEQSISLMSKNNTHKAYIATSAGQYQDAIDLLDSVPDQHRTTSRYWRTRAVTDAGMRRFDDASMHIDQSLAIEPHNAKSIIIKSHLLYQQGSSKQALVSVEAAIKHNPHEPELYYHLAQYS